MKTLILALSLLLSHSALASFYTIRCSAGDSSVQTTSGHIANKNIFKTYDKEFNEVYFNLPYDALTAEVLDMEELRRESQNMNGMSEWKNITYQRTVFTRTDGKLFPKHTIGVSNDRKSVTADLICQEEGNSMSF